MKNNSGVEATSKDYNQNINKWMLNHLIASGDILLPDEWKCHLFYPEKWQGLGGKGLSNQRQVDFINGASLFPALKRTLDGSLGVVFRKPTKIELSPELMYLEEDTDGNGKGLEQLIQDVTAENILQGYGGMLVDFADINEVGSKAQDEQLNKFATIQLYKAQHIRNVYTKKVGSASVVQQIILQESYEKRVNQFDVEECVQYRVLLLDEDGLYRQELRRPDEMEELVAVFEPKNSKGQRLNYIPFAFFGAESNDYLVDPSPLYSLSRMNAKHLEYSAMRNESIRQLAPTLFAYPGEGFDYDQFLEENPQGITMGGYNAYMLGQGGNAQVIQAASNDAAVEEMKHLEELMIQAGALLITPQSSNVSLETTLVQRSTDTSVLGMAVRNVESAVNVCLSWVADFMGGNGESMVDINREFFGMPMNAQDRAQWASEVMMGLVTAEEYRERLVKSGELPESALDEEISIDNLQDDIDNNLDE